MIGINNQLATIMQIDGNWIRQQREQRAWSQEHLAQVSGLGLRTIQRIESTGSGSAESALALASVFGTSVKNFASPPKPKRKIGEFRRLAAAGVLVAGGFTAFLIARGAIAEQVELAIGFSEDGAKLEERSVVVEDGHDLALNLNQSVRAVVTPEKVEIAGQDKLVVSFRIYEETIGGDSSLIGSPELLLEEDVNWVLEIDNAPSGKVYRIVVQIQQIVG